MSQTSYYRSPFGDTTYTKVFVGGLAWETPTEEMRRYFDQFGEILEAVIITDKNTGKSKGYGFVSSWFLLLYLFKNSIFIKGLINFLCISDRYLGDVSRGGFCNESRG